MTMNDIFENLLSPFFNAYQNKQMYVEANYMIGKVVRNKLNQ